MAEIRFTDGRGRDGGQSDRERTGAGRRVVLSAARQVAGIFRRQTDGTGGRPTRSVHHGIRRLRTIVHQDRIHMGRWIGREYRI